MCSLYFKLFSFYLILQLFVQRCRYSDLPRFFVCTSSFTERLKEFSEATKRQPWRQGNPVKERFTVVNFSRKLNSFTEQRKEFSEATNRQPWLQGKKSNPVHQDPVFV
jgi:hypothetical protein